MKYAAFGIDTETLALSANAVVLQIAIVAFNPWGNPAADKRGPSMCINLDIDMQIDMGREVHGDTVLWWMRQGQAAREIQYGTEYERKGLWSPMQDIKNFVLKHGTPGATIWGDRVIDMGNVASLMKQTSTDLPWKHSQEREYRNLWNMHPDVPRLPFLGIEHHALHDAQDMALQIQKIVTTEGIVNL